MSLGDVLDGTITLFLANWRTLVIVAGMFVVPLQLASAFLQRDLFEGPGLLSMLNEPSAAAAFDPAGGLGGVGGTVAALLAAVASVVVLPFIAGAISVVVSASYLGRPVEAGQALRAAGRRWWSLVCSWLLAHLLQTLPWVLPVALLVAGIVAEITPLAVVGGLLIVLAGLAQLLIMALFVAVAPAIVVEELGPLRALRRSAGLVRPRLWPVLGAAIVSGLVAGLLSSALAGLPNLLSTFGQLPFEWVIVAFGGIVAGLLTMPFVAIAATPLYFDARIRQEGFDLQVIAADLGARAGAREPGATG
jgi:hypothetical protein